MPLTLRSSGPPKAWLAFSMRCLLRPLTSHVRRQNLHPYHPITLIHAGGVIDVPERGLVIAVDDTGNEAFPPTHRCFGLGGCACLAKDYGALIADPWQELKRSHFDPEAGLHAASLRNISDAQAGAIGKFFEANHFFRFALTVADTVENPQSFDPADVICGMLLQRIADMANLTQPTSVFLILESSERLNPKLLKSLVGSTIAAGDERAFIQVGHLPKQANSPLLEVADFVIHAAGGQLRRRLAGRPFPLRKDFESVFWSVPQQLVHLNELLSVKETNAPPDADA